MPLVSLKGFLEEFLSPPGVDGVGGTYMLELMKYSTVYCNGSDCVFFQKLNVRLWSMLGILYGKLFWISEHKCMADLQQILMHSFVQK